MLDLNCVLGAGSLFGHCWHLDWDFVSFILCVIQLSKEKINDQQVNFSAHYQIQTCETTTIRMLNINNTNWNANSSAEFMLIFEMLFIRKKKPNLNKQSDSIRAKVFV